MWPFALANLTVLQLRRHPVRSLLTVLGVMAGMFLFTVVDIMQQSLRAATELSAKDVTLVVYRQNRFCPFASRLPQGYERKIAAIPGVREVYPLQIVVNNCSTSLDVVTFRGLPREKMGPFSKDFTLVSGSMEAWERHSDAALIGRVLAERRRVKVGDKLDAAGITVTVAGIIASDNPQDLNVGYLHLDYLQQASRVGLGIVTQFNVRVDDPSKLEAVANAIDETFRHDQDPTSTRPEKAFVAQAIAEISLLVRSGRLVGWAAILAVLALVSNTILLSVRGRVREYAVMQTLGYRTPHLLWMVMLEGTLLGLAGGLLGLGGAAALVHLFPFTLSTDALSVVFALSPRTLLAGLGLSLLLGILSGLVPAWRVARQDIVENLRAE